MASNDPFWYKLISSWCIQGNTGLSIPFIIGATAFIDGDQILTPEGSVSLLKEIFNYSAHDSYIRMKWCRNNHAYVIGLCDFDDLEDGVTYGKMHFSGDVIRDIGEVPDVGKNILSHYKNEIDAGLFSIYNNLWSKFPTNEIDFIKKAAEE